MAQRRHVRPVERERLPLLGGSIGQPPCTSSTVAEHGGGQRGWCSRRSDPAIATSDTAPVPARVGAAWPALRQRGSGEGGRKQKRDRSEPAVVIKLLPSSDMPCAACIPVPARRATMSMIPTSRLLPEPLVSRSLAGHDVA